SLQPTLPRGIDEVIQRALAKDPADRYATCHDFIAAARGALGAPSGSHTATVLAVPALAAPGAASAAPVGPASAAPPAPSAPDGAPAAPAASVGREATAPQSAVIPP